VAVTTDAQPVYSLLSLTWSRQTATFGGLASLLQTAAGSGVSLGFPSLLAKRAGGTQAHLIVWLESVGATTRLWGMWTPAQDRLALPMPLAVTTVGNSQHRLTTASTVNALVGSNYVYTFVRYTAADASKNRADLGQWVTGFALTQAEDCPGRLVLHLDDANGRFAQAGQPDTAFAMLRQGSALCLGLGYETPAGPRYAYQQPWIVTGLRRRQARGSQGTTAELVVEAVDALGWLDNATLPWTVYRTSLSNLELLHLALNPVTTAVAVPANPRNGRLNARVSLHAGTSYAQLLLKVIRELGYRLTWPSTQATTAAIATATLLDYEATTGPALHLGGTGETPLLAALEEVVEDLANHVLVTGQDPVTKAYYYGEAWDAVAVARHNQQKTLAKPNLNLANAVDCQDAANRHILRHTCNRRRTEVRTRYQLQAEVGDVVYVDDTWLGLADKPRWLRKIAGTYDARKGLFETVLTLQGSD
jgi:hypothetical protein